ncbi:MAG: nicotinate-nucleotide adenylyltransferase [Lachnospiraceae bacterium]|nr:nicotinate-nucleotide adenylyltransferase [Lachnospiraceae bacterium]MBQ8785731.1 nicotinate-nucleotide adenylyltransferase [Alphaproteobacteria bacterium]
MKIGIMGGTFNPIHNGHLSLANAALTQYMLDEVWFMPSGLPAHKANDELLPPDIRLQMVELAIQEKENFKASAFEIVREGFTYTADTMVALAKKYPEAEFYFIIGGDSLMKFHKWVRPEVISAHTKLLAAGRNGYTKEELLSQSEYLKKQFGTKVLFLDMPELIIASNEIRSFSKMQQYDAIKEMVPNAVFEYITENQLWKCPTN